MKSYSAQSSNAVAYLSAPHNSDSFCRSEPVIQDIGFTPVRLAPVPQAFDHPAFIFELKYDGFRALAHADGRGGFRLQSRNGHRYKIFPRLSSAIRDVLGTREAVLDGEIVCFGPDGRPRFYDLLRRTEPQHFCAFDLLKLEGRDLRNEPLIGRRQLLRALIPPQPVPWCVSII